MFQHSRGYSARKRRKERIKIAREKGRHTESEWILLQFDYNFSCAICGVKGKDTFEGLVKDHIVPVSRGGSDGIENIQPLCNNCNAKKGTKLPEEIHVK